MTNRLGRRGLWLVLATLVPALLWLLAFRYGPIAYLLDLSFQTGASGRSTFVGIDNYREAITADPLFRTALTNTIFYTVMYVAIQLPLALLIASGIDSIRREGLRQTVLAMYFMPLVTSTAATAVVFVFLYHPAFGLIDFVLRSVGLPTFSFLRSPDTALPSVVLMDVWKNIGFAIVVYFAGLSTIPRELYDAAATDGAGAWRRFRHVTIPLIQPTTALLLTVQVAETLKVFTPIYVMTGTGSSQPGGPASSTMVWSLYIFNQAFRLNRFGYAAALAILMFVLVAIFMVWQLRATRPKWEY